MPSVILGITASLLNFTFEDKLKKIIHVGFEVLTAVIRENMFLWPVTLCGLEKRPLF
jgi:hypothetical protein